MSKAMSQTARWSLALIALIAISAPDKDRIAKALRKGKKVKASLEVKFADKVNNKATKKLTVKLK